MLLASWERGRGVGVPKSQNARQTRRSAPENVERRRAVNMALDEEGENGKGSMGDFGSMEVLSAHRVTWCTDLSGVVGY